MARKFPILPASPHRICWGCDRYCAADDMQCGNGSDRTPHPSELFGEDWQAWAPGPAEPAEPDLTLAEQAAVQPAAAGAR